MIRPVIVHSAADRLLALKLAIGQDQRGSLPRDLRERRCTNFIPCVPVRPWTTMEMTTVATAIHQMSATSSAASIPEAPMAAA